MNQIIKAAVDRGASDLHIKAGDAFRARVHGKLIALTKQALTPEQTKQIALHLMPEHDRGRIEEIRDYDCSWFAEGIGRFRVNIMKQRGSFMIVMRVIPLDVPTFDKLQLPQIMAKIAQAERGMILVTGVTGSGKSSTMAAMIDYMNRNSNRHILTLENPIEFLHKDINSAITQREIGSDTSDFKQGLKSALRQDPDVIMIGEMRDTTTVDTAMKAAETGHLVLSTLHTIDAAETVNRIVDFFPPHQQNQIRVALAGSIKGTVCQRLVPRSDTEGRVAALEVMVANGRIQQCIVDPQKTGDMHEIIADGEYYGMQTFDQALVKLFEKGQIDMRAAMMAASNPSDLKIMLQQRGLVGTAAR